MASRVPEPQPKRSHRLMWTVVVALLASAAALWGSSKLTWFAEYRDAGVRGTVLHTENGADHAGSLVPVAALAVAGIAGIVATGGWPRRLLGTLLAIAGVVACWSAVDGLRLGGYADGVPVGQILTGRGLALVGGLVLVAGAVLAIARARTMPRLGARYAPPATRRRADDADTDLWHALSEGEDPTTGR